MKAATGEKPQRATTEPLFQHRWLRLLTYLVTGWLALGITLAGGNSMGRGYALAGAQSFLAGCAQGAAVVLALWRPAPAWALSLGATTVTALAVRPHLAVPHTPGADWPWATPQVIAQAFVLLLLALRVPTQRAVGAVALSVATTVALENTVGAPKYNPNGVIALFVFSMAVLVGITLRGRREARTRLVEQETITAEERARRTLLEERSRIARELHDVVAHHMSVISIQAQVAPHLVENPSEELTENLAGIRNNALEALTELRRVLGVLRSEHPDDIDDPDGPGAPYTLPAPGTGAAPDAPQPNLARLDALIENTRAAGLEVVTDIQGEPRTYSPGVELSAYRIVQEGLSNALRHAPGSTVRVEVSHFSEGLHLGIVNSRPQGPVQPSPGSGHGLLGMRERATMLGGHVTATPTLHGGFMVTAFLPRAGAPVTPPPPRVPKTTEAPTGDHTP